MRRLAALNAPHPAVWLEAMRNHPEQKKERLCASLSDAVSAGVPGWPDRFQALAKGFRDCDRPGAFAEADLEKYRTAWSQPGATTAMIKTTIARF